MIVAPRDRRKWTTFPSILIDNFSLYFNRSVEYCIADLSFFILLYDDVHSAYVQYTTQYEMILRYDIVKFGSTSSFVSSKGFYMILVSEASCLVSCLLLVLRLNFSCAKFGNTGAVQYAVVL